MGNEISKVCSCKNDNSTTDNECNTVGSIYIRNKSRFFLIQIWN